MQNIFVIGNSRGIGAGISREFFDKGYTVGGCSRSANCNDFHFHEIADITKSKEIDRAMSKFSIEHGKVDCVVISAGINHFYHPEEFDFKKEQQIIEVNLKGILNVFEVLFNSTEIKNNKCTVVMIGSVASRLGMWGCGAYCASKSGLRKIWESYRNGFKNKGVQLILIEPGFVKTDMIKGLSFPKPFEITVENFSRKAVKIILQKKSIATIPFGAVVLASFTWILPLWVLEKFQSLQDYNKYLGR